MEDKIDLSSKEFQDNLDKYQTREGNDILGIYPSTSGHYSWLVIIDIGTESVNCTTTCCTNEGKYVSSETPSSLDIVRKKQMLNKYVMIVRRKSNNEQTCITTLFNDEKEARDIFEVSFKDIFDLIAIEHVQYEV